MAAENQRRTSSRFSALNAVVFSVVTWVVGGLPFEAFSETRWSQSYDAGYVDENGAWAGGSEIMHLAAHKGKLYAPNGYWVDARWVIPPDGQKQSAQVLRLDAPEKQWEVDLDTGKTNGLGLQYMKGNILKSVTFTRDKNGARLREPETLLVMAAGANFERGGAVSAWVREDSTGHWIHTLVRHGSSVGGIRWVPRDMEVYRDKVTGVERLFMSLGNPGIISGVHDPDVPGKIRWDRNLEYPFLVQGSLKTRPLGMTQANGSLFFSEGDSIFQRIDGEQPTYREILDLSEDTDTDVGGIRGLTRVKNPNGPGDSLLFLWAPGGRSLSQVKRLDPAGEGKYKVHDEVRILDLMREALDVEVTYTLGAHNMMYPVTDPRTGETVHIIGFQGNIRGKQHLRWQGSALYAGAMYAIRRPDQTYSVHEVNNAYQPGKHVLVSPRTFCLSPFEDGEIYIGGHDSSRKISDNMAWVFRAPLQVALGSETALDAEPPKPSAQPDKRLLQEPVFELRIYHASENRFEYLKKRFREHTDRLFKKHGMEPVGYWVPVQGTPKERRRFIYILKHPSRYAAYLHWNHFSTDREWEKVLDEPQYQGLLAEKPTSTFMTATEFSGLEEEAAKQPGSVYELGTYVVHPKKLSHLHARFQDQLLPLFQGYGLTQMAYWTPFDRPDSSNTLVGLVRYSDPEQADRNWEEIEQTAEWKSVQQKLLMKPPERIYLRALDFSPLR